MAIPLTKNVAFNRPSMVGRELLYIADAISRGQLSGDGYYTKQCNRMIESISGCHQALITHSATAALEMAAILCDLAPGDEVIMPSFTFVSTANAVALRGATPVFVDIDPVTLNIDPRRAREAVTERTKAIFVVHYAGFPADMGSFRLLADEHDLWLVEDAAQALGSTYGNRPAGSLGDIAAFSFHETKNVISGEGGAIAITDETLVHRAEIIREKGTNRSSFFRGEADKYTWVDLGSSYLCGELTAAYLYAQLEREEEIKARRLAMFDRYMSAFEGLARQGRITRPGIPVGVRGNGHMFYLLLSDLDDRTRFIKHMKDNKVGTPFHYVPLHSAPAGLQYARTAGPMDVTDSITERLVRLPMFYELGSAIDAVIEIAMEYFEKN